MHTTPQSQLNLFCLQGTNSSVFRHTFDEDFDGMPAKGGKVRLMQWLHCVSMSLLVGTMLTSQVASYQATIELSEVPVS